MKVLQTISGILLLLLATVAKSQDTLPAPASIPASYLTQVSSRAASLEQKLDKNAEKTLMRFKKQEEKMRKRLAKIDSSAARQLLENADVKYKQLQHALQNPGKASNYIPYLDTLRTSLRFIEQNPSLIKAKDELKNAINKVSSLQSKFQKAEEIRKFLRERRQYLKEQLSRLGFARQLKKINKEVYYYSQQLNEYKALLKDKKKMERKVIELLSKTKVFKDLMKKHSQLASLFRLPGDPADPLQQVGLAGLQTRAQVGGMIQQQMGIDPSAARNTSGQQQFQQSLQQAQGQLQQLKNKLLQAGGDSDPDLPSFKPNNQKTKSFLKRLEFGTNIQTQKARYYFPVTSDIGLSLGYKLNDKNIIGIGGSYKMGLGTSWQHIRISHQGIGLRSYADIKWKGSFWISGGFEMNHMAAFDNFNQLKDLNAWQQSGLLGISKTISLKTKFFKKTKLQLLWDFLSYQQLPRTQPILFRIGYQF